VRYAPTNLIRSESDVSIQTLLARTIALTATAAGVAVLLTAGAAGTAAAATPTPVPGGANQMKGVSGGLSATLFNGHVRIRQMRLRKSTADEDAPDAGYTALTLLYLVSNGTNVERSGNFSATMADADGITINGHIVSVYSATYSLETGQTGHNSFYFVLPADFKPVKILLTDRDKLAFRVYLKASDVPASAPAAAPSP
jgi:hypothetical protein